MELQYIDYNCLNKGKTWSLLGEYVPGEDYQFNQNVAIIDGKLRIYCATGGVLGQVLGLDIAHCASQIVLYLSPLAILFLFYL